MTALLCECHDPRCRTPIPDTKDVIEWITKSLGYAVVAPGHQRKSEEVVARGTGFVVVRDDILLDIQSRSDGHAETSA